jgi:16S rRNA (cytosine967-C5)-methyltransferase
MKLHPLLIQAVAQALNDVFNNGKYADKVIEKLLKSNPRWGSRDRAFIAETTYDCVRWWRKLCVLSENSFQIQGFKNDDFTEIIGVYLVLKHQQDFDIFKNIHFDVLKKQLEKITDRKILGSIPDWLDEAGVQELGETRWAAEVSAMNQTADVVLRCNLLKINVLDLKNKLQDLGWESDLHPLSKDALVLKKRGNIFATTLFKEGYFEVQDVGSQLIAPFLEVEPGMRVVDACAGAGGKTLHLATMMKNKGRIIALDTEAWKLEELKKRARRNGISIIETRVIDTTKVIKRLHNSADCLLLDVPCSGLGVIRRNPDAKWKLKPEFIENIRQTQRDILQNYSKIVRSGGHMVYATCSILPSENQNQVQYFLKNNPQFKLIKEQSISPATEGCDGFYMALLKLE